MARLLLAFLMAASAAACTKEEYAAKFGALPTYTLHSDAEGPGVEDGWIVATVSYESSCPGGGSSFEPLYIEKSPGFGVYILSRGEPACEASQRLLFPEPVTTTALARLPSNETAFGAGEGMRFLAFPPDGDYELMKLATRASTVEKPAAAEIGGEEAEQGQGAVTAEEIENVRAELATQSEEDSRNHLEHCEAHPGTGCCTPYMLASLRAKLGVIDAHPEAASDELDAVAYSVNATLQEAWNATGGDAGAQGGRHDVEVEVAPSGAARLMSGGAVSV